MTKTKDQLLKVRVVTADQSGIDRDEVFIESAKWDESSTEPFINRAVYAKSGLFKDGEFSETDVAKLEAKSASALADEHAALIAKEAKEREAAQAKTVASKERKEG